MRRLSAEAISLASRLRSLRGGPRLRLIAAGLLGAALTLGLGVILASRDNEAHQVPGRPASPGGETVMAKFAKARTDTNLSFAEPTSASGLLSMALAPVPALKPPKEAEPNLAGLSEIPRELIWNRPPKKDEDKKRTVFAAFSKTSEQLPWDAVEPVPFSPLGPRPDRAKHAQTAKAVPVATSAPVELASREVANWVKSKVTEIKGSERSRPLYHFELWLEPPAKVRGRLVGVSYTFNTPAIRPQSQTSSDRTNGFRISAGGLACADEITLTLRFNDGRSETVALDGCKLLS